jgi:transposase-like protein
MTNGSPEQPLIIPPARDGHRRTFSEADKRRIVERAGQPGASLSEVARPKGKRERTSHMRSLCHSDREIPY